MVLGLKPDPMITDVTRAYWEATREGKLVLQQCTECGTLRHPPGPMCPSCRSLSTLEQPASGRGRIFSFTLPRHPIPAGFEDGYVVAIVELEEGPRVVTNILDADRDRLAIGMDVELQFEPTESGYQLPQFRPAAG
jgi:uncharacterized OB-fold protein